MSDEIVRVPRGVADQYWHRPWSEVWAAAGDERDGLKACAPTWTPWRRDAPTTAQYLHPLTGQIDSERFDRDSAAWRDEQDTCFLRPAVGWTWPADTTLLFQQNWEA